MNIERENIEASPTFGWDEKQKRILRTELFNENILGILKEGGGGRQAIQNKYILLSILDYFTRREAAKEKVRHEPSYHTPVHVKLYSYLP